VGSNSSRMRGESCWDHSIFVRNRSTFLHNVEEPYMKWKVRCAIGAELLQALSYIFSKLVVPSCNVQHRNRSSGLMSSCRGRDYFIVKMWSS
jgi:hypothetical protein